MVNANEFKNNSRYINAKKYAENKELQKTLVVEGVRSENINNQKKLTLEFSSVEETMVLNQTNLKTMINARGEDTDKWIGAMVNLTTVPTTFNGQVTKSLVISKVV